MSNKDVFFFYYLVHLVHFKTKNDKIVIEFKH